MSAATVWASGTAEVAAMPMRPEALVPEMLLVGGAMVILLAGSFLPRRRLWLTRAVAAAALVASAATAVAGLAAGPAMAFAGTFAVDPMTGAARLVVTASAGLLLLLARDELAGSPREGEMYALMLLASAGAQVMAGGRDLQVLVAGFLLTSIPLYALIGLARTGGAAEAAMKTYLLGALAGIGLLLGVALLYGVGGETSYDVLAPALRTAPAGAVAAGAVLVLAGVMFKVGAVPAHFWVPDAAQASGVTVAAFVTTVPKVGGVLAVYRFVDLLPDGIPGSALVAVLAVLTMTMGNLAAYWQDDPRRLLGWSTVSQAGYLLVPVAVVGRSDLASPSLLYYLAGYAVTNIAAFAVAAALPRCRDLAAFTGLGRAEPALGGALLVVLLGLVGTPPTAVFVGKLTTASAAWDGGAGWLAAAVLVNSVVSLFYYLRWIIPVFRAKERPVRGAFSPLPTARWAALVGAAISVALGIAAGPVWALLS